VTTVGTEALRVVVADDQTSVREGLVLLLGLIPDIEVIGAAPNGQEALDLVTRLHPDAILLDLHMPVLDGIETTRELTRSHPDVAIVILTTYDDDESVLAALRAGASSYLTKDADRSDIAHALHSAAAGLSLLDAGIQASLLASIGTPEETSPPSPMRTQDLPDGLTKREAEILTLIAGGMSNADLAASLYVSSHTIKSHINRIFTKTGSVDRSDAVRYAQTHGLV
jgi:DNA-binding NarL/FixJ family response regulator